jgi:hypothetical protein
LNFFAFSRSEIKIYLWEFAMFLSDTAQWAYDMFHQAKLGDVRRSNRLIKLASSLAAQTGKSIVQAFSSAADIEAAYRFVRNQTIEPDAIAEAGFAATVRHARSFDTLLALEDTTSLNFSHASVSDGLGHTCSHKTSRGFQAHSVLLFAPSEQQVVGLIEQHRWARDVATYGQGKHYALRQYESKESFKWERASRAMAARLGEQISKVISVCDREADLIEYLTYKVGENQRFVVRSMQSRCIEEDKNRLYAYSQALQHAGERSVKVQQRGGRKAREALCEIRYAPVTVKIPRGKRGKPVPLYYVGCQEKENPDGLCWHLLTSEPVNSAQEAMRILDYYEKRWLIEDFHKSWKTGGTQVEGLRMQSRDNLERMVVLLAFIAVRIQQLRYLGLQREVAEKQSCESIMSPLAWKLLWVKRENRPVPKKVPSLYWAYISLGKLAGWNDSKRTGRVGWERLWEGWFKLQTLLEGYLLARSLEQEI